MANKVPLIIDTSTNKIAELPTYDNLDVTPSDVIANAFVGDGSQLTNVIAATVTASSQPNITDVGTLTFLNVSGPTIINGNLTVSGNLVYTNVDQIYVTDPVATLGGGPNGAPLTTNDGMDRGAVLEYYTTAPVSAFMGWDNSNAEFAFGSNVTVSNNVITFNNFGNVRADNILGDFVGNVKTANQPLITALGNLTSLNVVGDANIANLNLVKFDETVANGGNTGAATITPDANLGSIFNYTLTGNITMNAIGNVVTGTSMAIILKQDGTGNRLLTSNWMYASKSKTLSTAANAKDIISVFYDGATYYASLTKGYV